MRRVIFDFVRMWSQRLFEEFLTILIRGYVRNADSLTSQWVLSRSVWVPILALGAYFLGVFRIMPRLLEVYPTIRKAKVFSWIIGYNAIMMLVNYALTCYFVYYELVGGLSPGCAAFDPRDKDLHYSLAVGMWFYFLSKILEFCGTFIMVLRRPEGAPKVHLYHHSSILVLAWLGLRFLPGGTTVILASVNTMTHVTIHLYYMAMAFQWFNFSYKHFQTIATLLQLAQFGVVMSICLAEMVTDCGYPRPVLALLMAYVGSIVGLFYGGDQFLHQLASFLPSLPSIEEEEDMNGVPIPDDEHEAMRVGRRYFADRRRYLADQYVEGPRPYPKIIVTESGKMCTVEPTEDPDWLRMTRIKPLHYPLTEEQLFGKRLKQDIAVFLTHDGEVVIQTIWYYEPKDKKND